MKKIIISVALVLLVGTSYASVTPVQNDVANIKGAVPAGTPSVGVSYEQKGFVGHLLGEIFELSGHIKNQFIVAFQDIDRDFANIVPKWDGQKFIRGSITDRGGNIGIGTSSPTHKLDLRGAMRQDHPSSNYDIWIQGGASTSGDNRNLAILGLDEDSGDRLLLNYGGEYYNGTQIHGGNFGIGTSNIPSKLTIEGGGDITSTSDQSAPILIRQARDRLTIDANEMQSSNNGAANNFAINPHGGSVGIGGFPSSVFKLDVNGKIRMRTQTSNSDPSNTVATKGYVDNKSTSPTCRTVSKKLTRLHDRQSGRVNCPNGYIVTGGGVNASWWGEYAVAEAFPSGNGYYCAQDPDSKLGRCYAICCQF